ncbi:Hypothetical protein, putative [Bodo saltans]|uniref:Secreted protein n=1 Tax=Bodo saltans TaxID=75058 RepID=A0A0S4IRS7_BODSA|nr:Hypothetical protein, putative [Bodo saltans]|eukprot:CUE87530.1 Hypothetical protein, putative [Bodo saltans]
MTVLPLFFLLRGPTALTPQDALDRRYQQPGPVGHSIYLTEHPCLWDLPTDAVGDEIGEQVPSPTTSGATSLTSHPSHALTSYGDAHQGTVLTMFACTVNLGQITKL